MQCDDSVSHQRAHELNASWIHTAVALLSTHKLYVISMDGPHDENAGGHLRDSLEAVSALIDG